MAARRSLLAVFKALLLMSGLSGVCYGAPGETELISKTVDGLPAGSSFLGETRMQRAVSADGRYVAFVSSAPNLVPEGSGPFHEVYVRDRQLGQTVKVSVALNGAKTNGNSESPSISEDGRYVAFYSTASNLVTGDTNGYADAFVRDLQSGGTQRVSVNSGGAQADFFSDDVSISADGRYVAFMSHATNLVPGDGNDVGDIFVRDRVSGITELVSVDTDGSQANSFSWAPAISNDGRYIAFQSQATNLAPGDTNAMNDVFVHDRQTGATEMVSVLPSGQPARRGSELPSISGDGRYVVFQSRASLVAGDTNLYDDIFVRDRQTGTTERVSVSSAEAQGNDSSGYASISDDGRYVAFASFATNLVTAATERTSGIFVRDRQAGTTERVSVYSNGLPAYDSHAPSISADGRFVAFYSWSFDINGSPDVFVHDRPGPDPGTMSYTLKPASLAFGDQTLLTQRTKKFKLSNTGTAVLPVQSVQLHGENTSQFMLLTECGVWVAVGGSCDIDVVFRPTWVGAKSARLRVVAGSNSIQVRNLTGTGVRSAFSVQPTSLAFGSVAVGATSAMQTVVITNIGTGVLPIRSMRIWGEQRGQFTLTHDCPSEVPVGGNCRARLAFRPTTVGLKSARLKVDVSGGAYAQWVSISGTGI